MFVSLTPRAFGLFALFGVLFGFSIHGLSIHGFSIQGFSSQGFNIQSFSIQVIERMGGFSPPSSELTDEGLTAEAASRWVKALAPDAGVFSSE